jgi:hypothetical protein
MIRHKLAFVSVFLVLATGCSEPSATEADQVVGSEQAPSSDLLAQLTPEYLEGEWCYVSVEFPEEFSEENLTYEFAADGTLKYQDNPTTPVEKEGSYEMREGDLVIEPTLMFLPLTPISVEQDEMTFEVMGGNAVWRRGACSAS